MRRAGEVVSKETLMFQLYADAELRETHTIDVLMGRLRRRCRSRGGRPHHHGTRPRLPLRLSTVAAADMKNLLHVHSLRLRFIAGTSIGLVLISLLYAVGRDGPGHHARPLRQSMDDPGAQHPQQLSL